MWHDAQVTVRKATSAQCVTGVWVEGLDLELRCSKLFYCTVQGWHGPPVLNTQVSTALRKIMNRPQLEKEWETGVTRASVHDSLM